MNPPKLPGLQQPGRPVASQPPADELIRYWDGIADALRVSVKTAQRYEKEYGLPVHRKRGTRGNVIYALRSELKAWIEADHPRLDEPAARAAKHRSRPGWWIAVAALLCTAAVMTSARFLPHRDPAGWRIDGQRLIALDADGRALWTHSFDFTLLPPESVRPPATLGEIADLDGDGRKELLFLAVPADEYKRAFYCFNHDGSVRFSVVPGRDIKRTVRYGGTDYAPPFGVQLFRVAAGEDGRKSVMIVSYDPAWFPSVLRKYSSAGRLEGEFWNPGGIYEVEAFTFGGRRLLFAGGTNNEFHAGAMAVLDFDHPTGFAPAAADRYRCRNCPAGLPLAYLVFPGLDVARAIQASPTVWRIHLDGPNHLSAHVLQTREPMWPGGPAGLTGASVYGFDSVLHLTSAELVEGYGAVHSALRSLGLIDHPLGPRDNKELLPALSWDGTSFEPVQPGR